jgi:hypothetical protein
MKHLRLITISILVTGLFFSCQKDSNTGGGDLYDDLNDGPVVDTTVILNPKSIEGLHQQIFAPKCATSGCHDGHFEPDFRTIQSTYTTLVRAKVFKKVDPFEVRVDPGSKESSWLWERITTEDSVLGKMPLYSPALSQEELDNIAYWIENGAKDANGNTMPKADFYPNLYGYYITDKGDTSNRYDHLRQPNDFTGAMMVPTGKDIDIWIGVNDVETDINALTVNELKFSTKEDDFSNAVTVSATFEFPGLIVPKYFNNRGRGYFFYKATVNTSQWTPGQQVYMRYYVQDGGHSSPIEIPSNGSEWYWKSRYSMLIQN